MYPALFLEPCAHSPSQAPNQRNPNGTLGEMSRTFRGQSFMLKRCTRFTRLILEQNGKTTDPRPTLRHADYLDRTCSGSRKPKYRRIHSCPSLLPPPNRSLNHPPTPPPPPPPALLSDCCELRLDRSLSLVLPLLGSLWFSLISDGLLWKDPGIGPA